MAQNTKQAETGTQPKRFWDSIGSQGEMLPFFGPGQDLKRKGFRVQFLTDGPRKETQNQFNTNTTDCWFDIIYFQEKAEQKTGKMAAVPVKMTWTINQISLLTELRRQAPLKNKIFDVRLVSVDGEWKEKHPKYKGNDRYEVNYIETREPPEETYSFGTEENVYVKEIDSFVTGNENLSRSLRPAY
jgi:hypothetical protein